MRNFLMHWYRKCQFRTLRAHFSALWSSDASESLQVAFARDSRTTLRYTVVTPCASFSIFVTIDKPAAVLQVEEASPLVMRVGVYASFVRQSRMNYAKGEIERSTSRLFLALFRRDDRRCAPSRFRI